MVALEGSVMKTACAVCGYVRLIDSNVKFYGDGTVRCFPECVEVYAVMLNKRRGPDGRFRVEGSEHEV